MPHQAAPPVTLYGPERNSPNIISHTQQIHRRLVYKMTTTDAVKSTVQSRRHPRPHTSNPRLSVITWYKIFEAVAEDEEY